jgi:hypothetical protein
MFVSTNNNKIEAISSSIAMNELHQQQTKAANKMDQQ